MDPAYRPQKKGLSGPAWLGIGCGSMIALVVVIGMLISLLFGPKIKEMAPRVGAFLESAEQRLAPQVGKAFETAQQNPARAAANLMIGAGQGKFEMSGEDDVNKRYTVRDKKSGVLFTIYWDAQANTVKSVKGDFSAIPDTANSAPH
jgi:uncharacterized iron-regulated membrane protein